jgi:hypothetical protein
LVSTIRWTRTLRVSWRPFLSQVKALPSCYDDQVIFDDAEYGSKTQSPHASALNLHLVEFGAVHSWKARVESERHTQT